MALDSVRKAVRSLLNSIPETFTPFNPESLTAAEEEACGHLIAGRLVEIQYSIVYRMSGAENLVRLVLSETGGVIPEEDHNRLASRLWGEWRDAYREWKANNQGCGSPFFSQLDGVPQWRLTTEGVDARNTASAGEAAFVENWTLSEGRYTGRPAARGQLLVLQIETRGPDGAIRRNPVPVTIENAGAVAKEFAAALAGTVSSPLKPTDAADSTTPATSRQLEINLARSVAVLDGTSHDVSSEQALRWIKVLADHPGDWISARELASYDAELDGVRTDQLKEKLPKPIQVLVDSVPGKGSRIRLT